MPVRGEARADPFRDESVQADPGLPATPGDYVTAGVRVPTLTEQSRAGRLAPKLASGRATLTDTARSWRVGLDDRCHLRPRVWSG
jgi:hypothetical protein